MPLAIHSNNIGSPSQSLSLVEVEMPECLENDVVVKVHALALNPIDYKAALGGILGKDNISFGWDGSGVITAVGSAVSGFSVGEAVLFAGSARRAGSAAEYVAVDARTVAKKPESLSFADAASFPLVGLTAVEGLKEQLSLSPASAPSATLLIINGGGGVGSLAVQVAKKMLGVGTVIATAGRDVTRDWCKEKGADHVLNHREPLGPQLASLSLTPTHVFCTVDLDLYFDQITDLISPSGKILAITIGDAAKIDVSRLFFPKRLVLAFELMFTKTWFGENLESQGEILTEIADFFVHQKFGCVITEKREGLSVESVGEGLELLKAGKLHGKFVIEVT
jgi:NADPH2:quinone reductase